MAEQDAVERAMVERLSSDYQEWYDKGHAQGRREAIEKWAQWAEHSEKCMRRYSLSNECTCGLSEALDAAALDELTREER